MGNYFFLFLYGIIIFFYIKMIEYSNVIIKYWYILKFMIGFGFKDYYFGEIILKLLRYIKVVGILDEICLMFCRGLLFRWWLFDDFLWRYYIRLFCVVLVVLKIIGLWVVVVKLLNFILYEIFFLFFG